MVYSFLCFHWTCAQKEEHGESSQPVWAGHREKEGVGLVISPAAGPGGVKGGGGGSTVIGPTFDFILVIISCQECGVLLG